MAGKVQVVKFWIVLDANVKADENKGLLYSSYDIEMEKLLLDSGAFVDGDQSYLPLEGALFRGHLRKAKLLLERGASGNESALHSLSIIQGEEG